MKTNLSFKIFGVLLLTALAVVLLMVAVLRVLLYNDFADYISSVEVGSLADMAGRMQREYLLNNDWSPVRQDPTLLQRIAADATDSFFEKWLPEMRPEPTPSNPIHWRHIRLFNISGRIFLLDHNGTHLAGAAGAMSEKPLMEVYANGKVVGWLGLAPAPFQENPLAIALLSRRIDLLNHVGIGVFLLVVLASILFSRHILAPVKKLTAGTRALASRKFNTRIHVAARDELGELARAFNTMAQTLERYEHLRRKWTAEISHELRTPLAVLRGEIEAVIDGVRPMNADLSDSIHAEVLRLSNLVDDFHTLSLSDIGAFPCKNEPVQPMEVLRETLQSFQTRLDQKAIAVSVLVDPGQDVWIPGDAIRLAQLFSNLLENTLRYTDGPGRLTVRQQSGAEGWHLFFEDTAPGVPDTALPHLFERLYRVDTSRSRELGGSGLGLSICRSIVSAHNGRIRAYHAASGGLGIDIFFPASQQTFRGQPGGNPDDPTDSHSRR